jgi:hypothetical protein
LFIPFQSFNQLPVTSYSWIQFPNLGKKYLLCLVHQGNWHGDVAIKILDMENMEEEGTLEAFRLDVATFRKTRHENLILFMGACMNPPKLAIVTSLCKGKSLVLLRKP